MAAMNDDDKKMAHSEIINCFSVDVEGFVESNVESFSIGDKYKDKKRENYEIEKNVNCLLQLLANVQVKGTFFFLGRIARDLPNLVKTAVKAGHEIACHGYEHHRIFNMEKEQFIEKVRTAKRILEDISGIRVYGFRAPDFSIIESSLWALDVLKEVGFVYDSSIYPTDVHDVYGIRGIESSIHKLSNGLIEIPLSNIEILGKRLPFGGGGYFRIYPLFLTKLLIARQNKLGEACMFYIHPYEVGPEIPKIDELSYLRKFRHYYNCKAGSKRIEKILRRFKFTTALDMLASRDFSVSGD
jgi:polysaccharide deacetylase family protein (PEP-CTERM system associated)